MPEPPWITPTGNHPPLRHLLTALAVIVPMAAITTYVARTSDTMTLTTMFAGPLVGGGAMIVWIVFLHYVVCGDHGAGLGFHRETPWNAIGIGLVLAVVTLIFHFVYADTVATLFERRRPAPQIIELITGVARDPLLLALWLGPVVWVGVALFEELARVFLLRRAWSLGGGATGRWIGIVVVSALIGAGHLYQGPASMLSIGLKSVIMSAVYLRTGRILSLIVAHALYDSVQIVMAVVEIRGAG